LDLGADINAIDDEGNTSLHYAIKSGCIKTIKKLILRGVKKEIKNKENLTAYNLAVQYNQNKIAEKLKTLTFIDKFCLMRTELMQFKYTYNDIYIIITYGIFFILKLIYLIRLFEYFENLIDTNSNTNFNNSNIYYNNNNLNDNEIKKCRIIEDNNCTFDMVFFIFTLTSLLLDLLLVFIVFYFICFIKKINFNKNCSNNINVNINKNKNKIKKITDIENEKNLIVK
jgi:hypothetical protein